VHPRLMDELFFFVWRMGFHGWKFSHI
jgi:hypothetical protein